MIVFVEVGAMNFWRQVYHLSGLTLLDNTREEPLGTLPLGLRSAALAVAERDLGSIIQVEWHEAPGGGEAGRCVKRWRWREAPGPEGDAAEPAFPTSLHDYFSHHGLLPKPGKPDEHFAERLFVERVFVPLFGLRALAQLQPQVTFCDPAGKQRAIDFVLDDELGRRYAIEIEGRTYHQADGKAVQFAREKFRQRALVLADYLYMPIAYSEIEQGDAAEAREALLRLIESNEQFHTQFETHRGHARTLNVMQRAVYRLIFEVLPVRFPFYQAYVIARLLEAAEQGQSALHIYEQPEDGPLLLLALFDVLALAERVARLYGMELTLPTITLHRCANIHESYVELAEAYLRAELVAGGVQPDHRRDGFAGQVTIVLTVAPETQTSLPGTLPAPLFDSLNGLRRRFGPYYPPAAPPATGDAQQLAPILDYFARRYFPVAELKPEQQQLLHRALSGYSGIGILPTGFGKSLVFQLYALLVPGTTLVISPLKSLIHDQLSAMHRIGLGCVHAITGNDSAGIKQWTLQQMAAHRIRLLYVSPERLRIKKFYQELLPAEGASPICALFIDEVHCISEWGHDFRPAYMAIRKLVDRLATARGADLPVIGLTATASHDVRADILEVLHLAAEDVVQLSTSDRSNLSLSVHTVSESAGAKIAAVTTLLQATLPSTLKITTDELLAYPQTADSPCSGVIFGMYANPHGRTMVAEGVHAIAEGVSSALGLPAGAVGIHASKPPSTCPFCGSATFISQADKPCCCTNCQQEFDKPTFIEKDAWQEQLEETQDRFYRGDFPLMVATKSYGMGIDKRNIRFIIHHAVSAGMESYYQEAGRAGRDGKPAHVALVCKLPDKTCYAEYLQREIPPRCVSEEKNRRYYMCPYLSSGLCDAGRQAHFIAGSYPGVEKDAEQVVAIYKELRDKGDGGIQFCNTGGKEGEDTREQRTDLALFRLEQMGLIATYTKEYQKGNFIRYEVQRVKSWTGETVAAKVGGYLAHSGLSNEAVEAALQPLTRTDLWLTGDRHSAEVRFSFIKAAAAILLQRVYDRVPRMRYTMLGSLLRYAINEQQRCRRLYIRTYFDDNPPGDNYRCEFCDVCHPDLQFNRPEAVVPAADRQLADVIDQLPSILAGFNPDKLHDVIRMADVKIAVVSMFEKLNRVLEEDATNVAALFLTGALARRQGALRKLALERLRFAFAEGERQGLDPSQLAAIYTEMNEVDATAALQLIERKDGPFDTPSGLLLVEMGARRLYGDSSVQHRTVRSLRSVRACRTLQADIASVAVAVEQLDVRLSARRALD